MLNPWSSTSLSKPYLVAKPYLAELSQEVLLTRQLSISEAPTDREIFGLPIGLSVGCYPRYEADRTLKTPLHAGSLQFLK